MLQRPTKGIASERNLSAVGRRARRCRGFTLLELLVVVAIIGAIIAILLPSLAKARRKSMEVICSTDLRTLQQVTRLYASDFGGQYMDFKVDYGKDPVYTQPNKTPYWMRQYYTRVLADYGIERRYFYSPFNPTWNADYYWRYNNKQWETVMGRFYFGSRTIQQAHYDGMQNRPGDMYAALFPTHTTDTTYFKIMWTDLNRQWPTGPTTDFYKPSTSQWGADHMYDEVDLEWPAGSHQAYEDGSVEWKFKDEIIYESRVNGSEIWWAE